MQTQLDNIYKLPETHIWVYGCCNEGGLPTVPGAMFGLLLKPANLSYGLRLPVAAAECSKGVATAGAATTILQSVYRSVILVIPFLRALDDLLVGRGA